MGKTACKVCGHSRHYSRVTAAAHRLGIKTAEFRRGMQALKAEREALQQRVEELESTLTRALSLVSNLHTDGHADCLACRIEEEAGPAVPGYRGQEERDDRD